MDTTMPHASTPPSMAQGLLTIAINLAMIVELFVAMYVANQQPDQFTVVFMKVFFGSLAPTLALGWLARRWLRRRNEG